VNLNVNPTVGVDARTVDRLIRALILLLAS